jgi:hypothetical protein
MLWVRKPFRRGELDTTLFDQVCQWLAAGRWFSLGTPVSSTNKTDRHNMTEILLKVKHHNHPTIHLYKGNIVTPYKGNIVTSYKGNIVTSYKGNIVTSYKGNIGLPIRETSWLPNTQIHHKNNDWQHICNQLRHGYSVWMNPPIHYGVHRISEATISVLDSLTISIKFSNKVKSWLTFKLSIFQEVFKVKVVIYMTYNI